MVTERAVYFSTAMNRRIRSISELAKIFLHRSAHTARSKASALLLAAALLCMSAGTGCGVQIASAAPAVAAQGQPSPVLRADGTLDLSTGFSGSLDVKGMRMVASAGKAPRFVSADQQAEDLNNPDGPMGSPESGPENVYWDDQCVADGIVSAAVADGSGNIYVGGSFYHVGGILAYQIARWNGTSWSTLGSGMNNSVKALAISGSNLYAGGNFTTAGGVTVNYVAKWNGTSWSALGTGMNNWVSSLAVSGSNLYAAGYFTTAGGTPAMNLARWNGTSWSAVGGAANNSVYCVAAGGGNVYAGGIFTQIGGVWTGPVARWDGTAWRDMGINSNMSVNSLAPSGTSLYVGGTFTTVRGITVNRIARWNGGTSWSALGSGLNQTPYALLVNGTDLYAGGSFTTAGGITANCIAVWNGTTWSTLGSGMNSGVETLAVSKNALFVGGYFTTAGGKSSPYFALWQPRVNLSAALVSESPGAMTIGSDPFGFYKPTIAFTEFTTVEYPEGLPDVVKINRADEIQVGGKRVNGAFTLTPAGMQFGGDGATLTVEFSQDDVALFGASSYTSFRAYKLTYPGDYPASKEAASYERLVGQTVPIAIRTENGKQIYATSAPISLISSTYGAFPVLCQSITRTAANPTKASTLTFTVTFSDAVYGVSAANFSKTGSLSATGTIGTPTTSDNKTWTVSVTGVSGSGMLGLDKTSNTGITDGSGAALTGDNVTGEQYTVDQAAPACNSIARAGLSPTNATNLDFAVMFSEAVSGVSAGNFSKSGSLAATGTIGTPSTSDNVSWTVPVTGVSGNGTLGLNKTSNTGVTDAAGNTLTGGAVTGAQYTVNNCSPTCNSITRADANPTSASTLHFTVIFSEPVTGVSSGNFTKTGTLAASGSVGVPVTADSITWTVPVTGVSGDGTLGLDKTSNAGVMDFMENAMAGADVSGAQYTVDQVAPAALVQQIHPTVARTLLQLPFTANDGGGSGIATVRLYAKAPGGSSFSNTGLSAAGGSGTFDYTVGGPSGLYEFAARATDNMGNTEPEPAVAECTMLVNKVPNGVFSQQFPAGSGAQVFPMTDDLDVTITLAGCPAGTSATVSRIAGGLPAAPAYFRLPGNLLGEALVISCDPLSGGNATLEWAYDQASDDEMGGNPVDSAWQFEGESLVEGFSVTPSNYVITIPGLTGFSTWYAGNAIAVPVQVSDFIVE